MTPPTGVPRGRPRKSATVSRISGDRPRKPAPVVAAVLSDAPEFLNENERYYWDQVAPELLRLGRLTELTTQALVDLVRWQAEADAIRAAIYAEGFTIPGQRGEDRRNPLHSILIQTSNQIAVGRNSFGLTALSHERFGLADPGDRWQGSDLLTGGRWG